LAISPLPARNDGPERTSGSDVWVLGVIVCAWIHDSPALWERERREYVRRRRFVHESCWANGDTHLTATAALAVLGDALYVRRSEYRAKYAIAVIPAKAEPHRAGAISTAKQARTLARLARSCG
jgi:hypothetical protein